MKAVLLCTDSIFKMLPVTYTIPREMIPVANKPLAEYVIDRIVDAGITNIIIVAGENRKAFESYFKDGRDFNCKIKYVSRIKQLGCIYDIMCAKKYIDDEFIVIPANFMFDFKLSEYVDKFHMNRYDAMMLTNKTDAVEGDLPGNEAITEAKQLNSAEGIMASAAVIYFFNNSFFMAESQITSSSDSEYSLANLVECLLKNNCKAAYYDMLPPFSSIESIRDIFEYSRFILSKKADKFAAEKTSRIVNSKVGDYSSIGRNCVIKNAVICNSIIMDDCIINGVEIFDSIVCGCSTIAGKGTVSGIFGAKTQIFISSDGELLQD